MKRTLILLSLLAVGFAQDAETSNEIGDVEVAEAQWSYPGMMGLPGMSYPGMMGGMMGHPGMMSGMGGMMGGMGGLMGGMGGMMGGMMSPMGFPWMRGNNCGCASTCGMPCMQMPCMPCIQCPPCQERVSRPIEQPQPPPTEHLCPCNCAPCNPWQVCNPCPLTCPCHML